VRKRPEGGSSWEPRSAVPKRRRGRSSLDGRSRMMPAAGLVGVTAGRLGGPATASARRARRGSSSGSGRTVTGGSRSAGRRRPRRSDASSDGDGESAGGRLDAGASALNASDASPSPSDGSGRIPASQFSASSSSLARRASFPRRDESDDQRLRRGSLPYVMSHRVADRTARRAGRL
jgi:hypothetical protein